MAQLIDYKTFIFNGINSELYDLYIVSTGGVNDERILGLNSSIEYEENSASGVKSFVRRRNNNYTFEMEIMKLDPWNRVLPLSEKEYDMIVQWLFTSEPKALEVGGCIHYGTFNNGKEIHNKLRQGIIKLTFESVSPYAYSSIMTTDINVSGSRIIELENMSNVNGDRVYLDLDILKTQVAGNILIENRTNEVSFKIKNLANNELIKVMGAGIFEVTSETNPSRNMFQDLEYNDFIYLDYGINEIEIVGDCRIRMRYQLPIALR